MTTTIIRILGIIGVCGLCCSPVTAQQSGEIVQRAISSRELVSYCGDKSNTAGQTTCNIFIQGVYDGYLVLRTPQEPEYICVKQPAPPRQKVVDDFLGWISVHSAYANKPAAEAMLRFLSEYFPCPKLSPKNDTAPQFIKNPNIQDVPILNLDDAKQKCQTIGFKAGTEAYGKCVLQLSR